MHDITFAKAYERLNAEQKKAVDTIEGPVMVIAGPGTGKTQILTLRIANILQCTDTQPESILALTFTESGARAMRERLASYIGASAYRVAIHTFHEFAGMLMRRYPDAYDRAVGARPISDLEKITLIESILTTPTITLLRPRGNPQFYIPSIIHALSLMKREYITPDSFAEILVKQQAILDATPQFHEKGAHAGKVRSEYAEREKGVQKNSELLFVYRTYEALLAEGRFVDYDDMIFETVRALEQKEDMLLSLQEQYQYILADEHQDVNGSQNRILELLASFHERPNIFVVGDEKQSIYRFQGASLENFLYFEEKFPHTTTIALTQNYRSAQGILDLSHELITDPSHPASALRVPLTSVSEKTARIEYRVFSHEAVEQACFAQLIQTYITEGVPEDEIAVIVRTNREVEEISSYLRKQGLTVSSSADGDILTHPITAHIRTLIRALTHPEDERPLFDILHSGYSGVSLSDVARITRHRSFSVSLMEIMSHEEILSVIGVEDKNKVMHIAEVLATARVRTSTDAPQCVLEYLLKESGLFEVVISRNPLEGARVIRRLYDEVESLVRLGKATTIRDIEEMFSSCVTHGIALNAPYIHTGQRAVQVMTAHKAKGLEFLHVFIPHLIDSKWGGKTHPEYFKIPITQHISADAIDPLDDERKLLYVACTRAKVGLHLSNAHMNTEGRALLPTRLLEGIGGGCITYPEDVSTYEDTFCPTDVIAHNPTSFSLDVDFLRNIIMTQGLSATSFNNYLRSPWDYLYRNVFHIPEIQPESARFGTIVHGVLERVFQYRRQEQGAIPTPTHIKNFLEHELERLPITHDEYVRHHAQALETVLTYLAYMEKQILPHDTKEEYKLQVILPTGNDTVPTLPLTGMFDRLDFDAEGMLTRVVDYKTGKPRTRGYIEGTTKDSHGDYKRQLTFYALLLSLHDDERFACRNGLLSFVEADEKGKIHEELYTITDEEIISLKDEIIRVALEIAHGTFLNVPCDPHVSSYCHLVSEYSERKNT